MKKVKIFFYSYLILFIVLVVMKFDGSFHSIQNTMETIKHNRDMGIMNVNLVPFRTLISQYKHIYSGWAIKNLLGNMVVFIPFGCLLSLVYETFRRIIPFIAISISSILCIEIVQFIFMIGFFDVDDIILNFIGAMIGYALCILGKNVRRIYKCD